MPQTQQLIERHLIKTTLDRVTLDRTTLDRITKEKIYNFVFVAVLLSFRPKNIVISKKGFPFESISDFFKGSPRVGP